MIRPISLCTAALLADAVIGWQLVRGASPTLAGWFFPLAHGAACLLFSLSLPGLLPRRLQAPPRAFVVFAFASAFFIPALGMAGLLTCVIPALHKCSSPAGRAAWRRLQLPDLPVRPAARQPSEAISDSGNLAGALREAGDPKRRSKALIATLAAEDRHAAPLLRLALKDPADDVRLLAYILLNRKEKWIVERVRARKSQLDGAEPGFAFALHKALAHDYWELACLATSAGSAMTSFCMCALEHAQAGLLLQPRDIDLQLLCGRVHLRDMQLDAASKVFASTLGTGLPPGKIAPFLAEIAFFRRHYSDVKKHLARAATGGGRLLLDRISAYWVKEERAGNDLIQS